MTVEKFTQKKEKKEAFCAPCLAGPALAAAATAAAGAAATATVAATKKKSKSKWWLVLLVLFIAIAWFGWLKV